ncbi:MAG: hypothetical protein ACOY46_12160 [Bacillota bacterium]
MNREVAAYITYIAALLIMAGSALWVMWDAWKSGKPWSEILVWGLFAGAFFGIGPIFYVLWKRKFG